MILRVLRWGKFMSQPSSLFVNLEKRFQVIYDKFLKPSVEAELADKINYKADVEGIAAFRLLFHAEVEDYLERKASEARNKLDLDFRSKSYVFSLSDYPNLLYLAWKLKVPFERVDEKKLFWTELNNMLAEKISDNNGVKSESFRFLSTVAGFGWDAADTALLADFDSFGASRGNVAHKGLRRVDNIDAPTIELERAKKIINHLRCFFYP